MRLPLIAVIVLWWSLITYAVLGGADFGAGIWTLFAGREARRQRDFISHALGPVWEANHVWLIFLIVGLFSIFPTAFASISIALFLPLSLALIGIVLRGAAFIFRGYSTNPEGRFVDLWSKVFSASSILTPFFLGISAAAVAGGNLLTPDGTPQAGLILSWLSPFAVTIGIMAVSLCATLAAIYLLVEADQAKDTLLVASYRQKAIFTGALTALLGALGLVLSLSEAPRFWEGMLQHAIPVVIITMLVGIATALALLYSRYQLARVLIIVEAAFILGSWGISQYPYLIPPHVTIYNSANDDNVILIILISIAVGMVILVPSIFFLLWVFKRSPEGKEPEKTPIQNT